MLEQIAELDSLLDEGAAGGGTAATERLRGRGKLPVRERIAMVLDEDSPFLEISPLAGYGSDYALGGGIVCGIGIVSGTDCVIVANDPTVLGGAITPYGRKKWMRGIQIARENGIPYLSFVESAGADLRRDGSDRSGQTSHFAETGRAFYEMIQLSKLAIPTVCVVFGSATAGGAYQPGLSDYVIVVEQQAQVFLAGPPLVKMATGEITEAEALGGARMHAEVSGLADYFAVDELDAIRMCREVVAHLPEPSRMRQPAAEIEPPRYPAEELLGLVSRDLAMPLDVRQVIARIADGSRFEEFKATYGRTMICGWATIHGQRVGVIGNNGAIFPDASQKAAHFIQLCNQVRIPLVFLHNVPGFMVGREFEEAGIVKKGSQLVNAVSNSTVPHLTVVLAASYGAGTYGMSGRAFGNRFTFLWPTAKLAVMGPRQIAGVMSQVRRARAERMGQPFDEDEDARLVARTEQAHEAESRGLVATGAVTDDGIIDPRDTRDVLGYCLQLTSAPLFGAQPDQSPSYGVFRL
ncbi:acyl-CoA carboxylase subunit beta [Micromonospora inositola]|nr:carboxyl transferase domain-containing protein [Micromonospora inositola]